MQYQNKSHILAIDPSLRNSGWALFSLENELPLAWGVIFPDSKLEVLSERLLSIQTKIEELFRDCKLGQGDYLVCEGPAPVSLNPSSSIKVEQVRSMFETLARAFNISVPGRLNPRTVQAELLSLRGKQLPRNEVKQIARTVVNQLFKFEDKNISQDVIDAILIGVLARNKIIHSNKTGHTIFNLFEGGRGSTKNKSGRGLRWSSLN